ncbi:MAG: isopentenyl phosphate kinase [Patescibacteria group bacterium]
MSLAHTSQEIILIKLGGSIITNKEVPMMVREGYLQRLIEEIARARKETKSLFILGHGQGSFAHVPALRYKTIDGFINGDSLIGMAITQDSAAKINRIVVEECLSQELPAVSFTFSNTLVTKNKKKQSWDGQVLEQYLFRGLLPVTYGDVIVDSAQGCTIWSTETIFSFLAQWLGQNTNYRVKKVVHVNEVAGVLDNDGQMIPEILMENMVEVKKAMTKTKGFDVTGGMWHKIEESLKLAKQGIEIFIISGLKKDNLYKVLTNQECEGTRVISR